MIIINDFGASYAIDLDGRATLIGTPRGNRLIFVDQEVRTISSGETMILNGEIYESAFNDLVFNFTTRIKGKEDEDCSLILKEEI